MFWFKILIIAFLPIVSTQTFADNFGPYTIKWSKYEVCKGPKQSECGKVRLENQDNLTDVIFHLDMEKDCPITKARVIMISKASNGSSRKAKWNYSLDSPCQHFVLGPILKESLQLTNNCKLNKGNYDVNLNMTAQSTMFLGNSFFYGNYAFKVYAHNNKNNFFCIEAIMDIEKKN